MATKLADRHGDFTEALKSLTVAGTGSDVVTVARCAADDVQVDGSLAGGEPHQTLGGVGPAVAGADGVAAGVWRALLRTDAVAVFTAGALPTRHRRTRVCNEPINQSINQNLFSEQ